jgi:hypothetical protein
MLTPWGNFLKAVADGTQYEMKWMKGFGVVVLIAVPPFPYQAVNNKYNPQGVRISFCEKLTEDDWTHIHFSEVSQKYHPPSIPPLKGGKNNPSLSLSPDRVAMDGIKLPSPLRGEGQGEGEYIISGKSGYVMCVTGVGETVQDAREKACKVIDKIVIPKMFYRNDIGQKFIDRDKALLKKWGYV